jgi:hypothetical protein
MEHVSTSLRPSQPPDQHCHHISATVAPYLFQSAQKKNYLPEGSTHSDAPLLSSLAKYKRRTGAMYNP